MRSKRDIKMGRLCTTGGAVLRIVGGGVTFRFLNGEAILDESMLFWVHLYALVVVLKILLDFRLFSDCQPTDNQQFTDRSPTGCQ